MNLFKKTTATLALVALVSGIFSTGVSAASNSEIDAANSLATNGYINDHSDDTAAYNLNQNVLRQEIAAVARGIAGLEKKTSCDGSFTDVTATTPNTWACLSVEALLDADLIAANTMFKPENEISKAEAIGMMVKASFGSEYAYDAGKASSWQEQVVDFAAGKGVVASFTNYDTAATRGFVFEAGYNAKMASDEVVEACDEVSQLLGLCDEDVADAGDDEEDDTPVVITGENFLAAELSAATPAGTDLPVGANGVVVLAFDVTAGSEDVSITAMELERTGFGESAADAVAIYTDEGRASKVKTFSSSDDMANLTFSPAVIIKAGETRTLTAKVNTEANTLVWPSNNASTGEFAVEIKNITASSPVDTGTIVSNYFDVKAVESAQLTITDEGVNSAIKAGESQADIAEFRLTNEGNLSTDVDITVTSVTLKEIGSVDQEDVLENITLTVNGEVIDTVASMDGKYLTFNFDAIVIEDDKNETFSVNADIMGGAGDEIQFVLDNVIDITASASKYNAVNIAGTYAPILVDIDAGELTLYSIDAESDEMRSDKTNVVLGQIKVVNVAGQNLELQNLGVELVSGSATTIAALVENVEFEVNGTSYDLNADAGTTTVVFSDTDLNIILPQGTTILTVRADTLAGLADGESITLGLTDASDTSLFRVEETEDDVVVTDITPNSLSFDTVDVLNSAATAANVPLANVSVVKGAADLVALQFEIEAGKASYVTTDKIKVTVMADAVAATKNEVSEVALYKGSVSTANLLDKVSGSKLAAGVATFDGFEVEIAADATQTFVVTLSTVDTDAVVGKVITASIAATATDIELEDDENDVITLTAATLSDKTITMLDSGVLTVTDDANNDANSDIKTVLAGTESTVYSADILATNEDINVETVRFTLDDDLKNVIASAKLYQDNTLVASASNSDVLGTAAIAAVAQVQTITFTDVAGTGLSEVGDNIDLDITFGGVTTTYSRTGNVETMDAAMTALAATIQAGGDVTATYDNATDTMTVTSGTAGTAILVDNFVFTDDPTTANNITAAAATTTVANVVASAATSTVTFDNISNLDISTEGTQELKLAIVTENIGFEKIGEEVVGVSVTLLEVEDAKGVNSGEDVVVADTTTTNAVAFDVVPVVVTASVAQTLSSNGAKITLTADSGNNTQAGSNASVTVDLDDLTFTDNGGGLYKVYEDGQTPVDAFAAINTAGASANDVQTISFTDTVTIVVLPDNAATTSYSLELTKNGIGYNTTLSNNMSTPLSLGSYDTY